MPPILTRANQFVFGAVLLVQLLFLAVGSAMFPGYWVEFNWGYWMPIYFALTVGALIGALAFSGKRAIFTEAKPSTESSKGPNMVLFSDPLGIFPMGLLYFAMGFVVAVILFQFPGLAVTGTAPPGDAFASTVFTIFVIGFTETLLLQWFLVSFLWPLFKWFSIPVSAVVAVLFHWAHYGGDLYSLMFIFVLFNIFSLTFVLTRRQGGMGLPWGAHSGWDMGVSGLLTVKMFSFVVAAVSSFLGMVH